MLKRLIISLVVGIFVYLACLLLGALLQTIEIEFVLVVGEFLEKWAGLFGLLAGLYEFFAGGLSGRIR